MDSTPHTPVALGPELTIAFASAAREQLLPVLAPGPAEVELDLAGVTDFDSSAVQLLLATRRSLQAQGRTLRLHAASDAVRSALATFGLQHLLHAPH